MTEQGRREIPKITDAEWAEVKHVGQDGVMDGPAIGATPVEAELPRQDTIRRGPSILGRFFFWRLKKAP